MATSSALTTEPTAAARVFAIPELLEHILICLADTTTKTDGVGVHKLQDIQPLTALSAVCRVSREFRDTLKTSNKLQRHMFNPVIAKKDHHYLNFDLPHGWVIHYVFWDTDRNEFFTHVRKTGHSECLGEHLDSPEASWRKVRLFESGIVDILLEWKEHSEDGGKMCCDAPWRFEDGATGGEFFDICRMCEDPSTDKSRRAGITKFGIASGLESGEDYVDEWLHYLRDGQDGSLQRRRTS